MGESAHRTVERSVKTLRIVIIGSGNVATHLAHALAPKANIVQIMSPHIENAQRLADTLPSASAIDKIEDLLNDADCYIVAIKDDAIAPLLQTIKHTNGLWIHTSGSVPASVFEGRVNNYGVLYPLQTFTRNININLTKVPFFIEGSSPVVTKEIQKIAELLSSSVYEADSHRRKLLHIAAVFACNYTNHLWTIANEILRDADLPFSVLHPLILATIDKAASTSPFEGQTGPARRGDTKIIDSHISLLDEHKAEIYRILANSILQQYNPTHNESH